MKAKFKVGDVVKVKSGSPHMTISGLSTKFKSLQKESKVKIFDGIYHCTWFQDNKAFNEKFQETVFLGRVRNRSRQSQKDRLYILVRRDHEI